MNVFDWIRSFWKPGDFQIVPKSQNATVIGRITQLTVSNAPTVRPIEERIKELAQKASRRRSKRPQVRRSDGSLRKPKG